MPIATGFLKAAMIIVAVASLLAGCTEPTRIIIVIAQATGSTVGPALLFTAVAAMLVYGKPDSWWVILIQLVVALFLCFVALVVVVIAGWFVLIIIGALLLLLKWPLLIACGLVMCLLRALEYIGEAVWLVIQDFYHLPYGKWYRSFISWFSEP